MPYNTRRKSLSLPSLGIHLPSSSRAHRSPSKPTSTATETTSPPSKRVKRSHDDHAPLSPTSSTSASVRSSTETAISPPERSRGRLENTPPPSPGHAHFDVKIDTDGINDDIVVAVIEQLEKTGNRPHLIKELATVLAGTNESVAQYVHPHLSQISKDGKLTQLRSSANPAALLSSRLSLYLKRPWTALAPCPLAKELIPVHPRKVFFYLTTTPHQKLPESSDDIITHISNDLKRLTPSVSPSVDQDDVDRETRSRMQMSPSPEVDLSSPDLDQDHPISPPTPGESFSGRSSVSREPTIGDNRVTQIRAPSPPLEADEKGFTETASAARARALSVNDPTPQPSVEVTMHGTGSTPLPPVEETAELRQKRDQELGYELFGHAHTALVVPQQGALNSPMIPPREDHRASAKKAVTIVTDMDSLDADLSRWELRSPENVELDELDGMFTGF